MLAWSNKKKIRGWKKQIRKINKWYNAYKIPDIKSFEEGRDDYRKIWIDPWYRLVKRNPPLWYFRLVLEKMVTIYKEWDKVYKENGAPYDIQIWLFDPHWIYSQICCVKVDSQGELRDNFFNKSELESPFPCEKFSIKNGRLDQFIWTLRKNEDHVLEKAFDLSKEEIDELLKKGYKSKVIFEGQENEDIIYSKQIGDVWIGRLKK